MKTSHLLCLFALGCCFNPAFDAAAAVAPPSHSSSEHPSTQDLNVEGLSPELLSTEEREYLRLLGELEDESPTRDWWLAAEIANTGLRDSAWTETVVFNKAGLLSLWDELSLSATTDSFESSGYLGLQYDAPIAGSPNWHWHLGLSEQTLDINALDINALDINALDINGRLDVNEEQREATSRYRETVTRVETGVQWHFAATSTHITTAEAGLLWDRVDVDYDAPPLFSGIKQQQDLVKPYLALYYRYDGEGNSVDGGLRLEKNLPSVAGDNARDYERLGRVGVEQDYRILSADFGFFRRYRPGRRLHFKLWGRSGFGDRLVPQEQFVVGGLHSVRGYPEGQVAADAYHAVSLEHQWTKRSELPHLDKWTLSIFAEGGWFKRTGVTTLIRRDDFAVAQRIFPDDGELASVGMGLSWQFKPNLELILDYGMALKPVRENKQTILVAPDLRTDTVQRIRLNPEALVDKGDSELHLQVRMRF